MNSQSNTTNLGAVVSVRSSAVDIRFEKYLPPTGDKSIYFKRQLKNKLIEHRHYINKEGQVMPEIQNWKWNT